MGSKMKHVNIVVVLQFLGEGVTKNNIYEELPKKGGFVKIGRVFLRRVDTSMHTIT